MQTSNTFHFTSTDGKLSSVSYVSHSYKESYCFAVSINDQKLSAGKFGITSLLTDLINLSLAVFVADRFSMGSTKHDQEIKVVLPLKNSELFKSKAVIDSLSKLLYWYTGDHWDFEFRAEPSQVLTSQRCLDFELFSNLEVALWSGGLDSLAGLCNRMMTVCDKQFILVGTGSNKYIHHVQKSIIEHLEPKYQNRIDLIQAPISFNGVEKIQRNPAPRARGFLFLLIGSVRAYISGLRSLTVYENGIGAINLPYRASETGLDHSRSVHPKTLTKMSEFISSVLGEPFQIVNPFLMWTKAEMCKVFVGVCQDIPQLTSSCDSRHRQRDLPTNCGYCTSCLLRRQALSACGIADKTDYVTSYSNETNKSFNGNLDAMLFQVDTMQRLHNSDDQWSSLLFEYPEMSNLADLMAKESSEPVERVQSNLISLYARYVKEWALVRSQIESDIIKASKTPPDNLNQNGGDCEWKQISLIL